MSEVRFKPDEIEVRHLSRSVASFVRDGRVIATVCATPDAPPGTADALALAAADYARVVKVADEAIRRTGKPAGGAWDGAEEFGEAEVAGRTYPRAAE